MEQATRAFDLRKLHRAQEGQRIGLDLGGKEPAETALAIMSEIVATRFGGSGAPMRDRIAASAAPKTAVCSIG